MDPIALQVFQRSPRYEIGGQLAFAVTGEDPYDFGEVAARMKRRGEMALVAEVKPLLKAENITASLDASSDVTIPLSAAYKNAADAQAAEHAIVKLAEMGRKELANAKDDIESFPARLLR